MRRIRMVMTLSLLFLLHVSPALAATKAIRFGKLIDGTGKVLTNVVVIVDGERIKSVSTAQSALPPDTEVIDLSRYTGIPGLMDIHTHLAGAAGCPSCAPPTKLPAELMVLAQENARKMLDVGITTVRDLGAVQFMDIAMRNLINEGAIVGPRMFVSGPGLRTSFVVNNQSP